MNAGNQWIRHSSECAQAWSQPRWHLQLLPSPRAWVHAQLPGTVPAAVAVSSAVTYAVTTAGAHLPAGHGA